MRKIRITRASTAIVRGSVNFKPFSFPVGEEVEADDAEIEALTNSSVAFEYADEEGGPVGGVLAEPPSTIPEKPKKKKSTRKTRASGGKKA